MKRLLNSIILSFVMITVKAEAAQRHILNEEETLKVNVSRTRINRVSITDDSINKIVGNSDEFEKETVNGNLFILPRGEIGSQFEITLNLDSGRSQALRCKVVGTDEGQIILLNANNKRYRQNLQDKAFAILREMRVMQGQHSSIYNELVIVGQAKVLEAQKIDYKELVGFRILIKNDSRKEIIISEKDLVIPNHKILAVSLDNNVLKAGNKALIFAVAEKR